MIQMRSMRALHCHGSVDDSNPAVNLVRIVKLVTYVNDGTEIISNIKYDNAAEAVIKAESSGRQTLGHGTIHSRAGLVQARGQILKFGSAHISVVPENKESGMQTQRANQHIEATCSKDPLCSRPSD